MNLIYGNPYGGFGDIWGMVSHAIYHSGSICYFSEELPKKLKSQICEIFSVLNTYKKPKFVSERSPKNFLRVEQCSFNYISTKPKWSDHCYQIRRSKEQIITYQIISPHSQCLPDKNLTPVEIFNFKQFLIFGMTTYKFIEVGIHQSLSTIINLMCLSKCFLGICSGMSHVAHSTGVPIYLRPWKDINKYHPCKNFKCIEFKFSSLRELL